MGNTGSTAERRRALSHFPKGQVEGLLSRELFGVFNPSTRDMLKPEVFAPLSSLLETCLKRARSQVSCGFIPKAYAPRRAATLGTVTRRNSLGGATVPPPTTAPAPAAGAAVLLPASALLTPDGPPALPQRLLIEGVLALEVGDEIEIHVPPGPEQAHKMAMVQEHDNGSADHHTYFRKGKGSGRGGAKVRMLRFSATVLTNPHGALFLQGSTPWADACRLYTKGEGITVTLLDYPTHSEQIMFRNVAPAYGGALGWLFTTERLALPEQQNLTKHVVRVLLVGLLIRVRANSRWRLRY